MSTLTQTQVTEIVNEAMQAAAIDRPWSEKEFLPLK